MSVLRIAGAGCSDTSHVTCTDSDVIPSKYPHANGDNRANVQPGERQECVTRDLAACKEGPYREFMLVVLAGTLLAHESRHHAVINNVSQENQAGTQTDIGP